MNRANERQSRAFQMRALEPPEGENRELWVEGRAVVFDTPTVLFSSGGVDYKEQIDRNAFEGCQMDDVIFVYNHEGAVMARTRNGTLELDIREDGLYIKARLDGTQAGRDLYESIKGGYIDRMSFSFTVREEAYDSENHTWTVRRIKRLYDTSAVSMPAYEDTSISARKQQVDADNSARLLRQRLALRTRI